jgi:DNA mismatch endonuclease, patch repair protein
MQANRSRDTEPELAVRRILHRGGLRYRVDFRLAPPLRRRADIVFTRARVAVFIDGCFWHGCETHYQAPRANSEYWVQKRIQNQRRDDETDRILQEQGWTVLRFWEHEDPKSVAGAIRLAVQVSRRLGPTKSSGFVR